MAESTEVFRQSRKQHSLKRFLVSLGIIAVPSALLAATPTLNVPLDSVRPAPTVSPRLVTTLKPDLVIDRIATDASCRVVVTVVNRGPGRVPDSVWTAVSPTSSSVYLTVDGRPWGGQTIWKFDSARKLRPAGGVATVTLSHIVKGSISAKVSVDHTAQVAEADERNNVLTKTLTCGAPTVNRTGIEPAATAVQRSAPEPATSSDEADWGSEPDTSSAAPMVPASGGSLLESPLPPPPQDAPAPPPREDRTVEPAEVVVASSNMAEAQALAQVARGLGFGIKRRSNLQGLGLVVTVLRVPRDMGVGNALTALRQAAPSVWADANHRYGMQGDRALAYGRALIGWQAASPYCGKGVRVGMLDTPLAREHPALKGREIATRSVLPAGIPRAKPDHGTAVAALLIGNKLPSGFGGLLPSARLYAAEIFRARGEDGAETTAEWIVAAFDWLAVQKVQIINLSLGGPRNLLLEAATGRLLELGTAIVAAGGNGGPDAPPVYPAAQRGVVAVTAVDAELKPYRKATRGEYLAFAAPGVDVWSAAPGKQGAYYSGTSYAAPFVTAALAARKQAQPKAPWQKLIHHAQSEVRDLGAPGKDPVYGWGLVQAKACGKGVASVR